MNHMKVSDVSLINATIVALYNGSSPGWKLGCSKKQLKAMSEALVATKGFEVVLMKEGVSLDSVNQALQTKHAYAKVFEREFGFPWPL